MTPADVTREVVAGELPAIASWADRHGWDVTFDAVALRVAARTKHPAASGPTSGTTVVFHADVAGYPAHPPAWWCGSSPADRGGYPAPGTAPGVSGSVFHTQPCICAPWNRLAYAAHCGPHSDWQHLGEWKSTGMEYTQAHTLGDMLSTLRLHLQHSPGMMT